MNEIVSVKDGKITVAEDMVNKIIEFNKAKKEMEYQEKLLKEGLLNAMKELDVKKFVINGLSATVKEGSTRTIIDSKRLKAECPDIYDSYSKTTIVNPSLVLTVSEC